MIYTSGWRDRRCWYILARRYTHTKCLRWYSCTWFQLWKTNRGKKIQHYSFFLNL